MSTELYLCITTSDSQIFLRLQELKRKNLLFYLNNLYDYLITTTDSWRAKQKTNKILQE